MKIKSITKVEPETVYAIQTLSGTYVADGLAHHNCQICNRTLNGNYKVYEPKIKQELGVDEVQKMWDKAYDTSKMSTILLNMMVEEMEKKLKNLNFMQKNS